MHSLGACSVCKSYKEKDESEPLSVKTIVINMKADKFLVPLHHIPHVCSSLYDSLIPWEMPMFTICIQTCVFGRSYKMEPHTIARIA